MGEEVVLKIENVNEIILDATSNGDSYKVIFTRLNDVEFEQTVIGENICECCGEALNECECNKEKAIIGENILLNYFNSTFSEEDIMAIIDGVKYRKAS